MIKEKHEKGADSVKDEPGSSDKDSSNTDVRIKKEEDPTGSCAVKKEPTRPVTKNGGIIGSTNVGSVHVSADHKPDTSDTSNTEPNSIPLKTEECLESNLPSDAFGLNISSASAHHTPPDGVQPLPSNVINKQANNMEVQYMQQQSQIFVFSTMLANSGAEEVLQGRYASIIAYHCAQPGTKKYLEKNPLKVNQFNRQNPAQWLNNLAMIKNKGCTRSPGLGPKGQSSLDSFLGSDSLDEMVGLTDSDLPWDQKNSHQLEGLEGVSNGLPDVGPDMDSCSPSLANMQPSLQGVKVPDENLTPQQRQHREEQLATIRKMQQMLFPESQTGEGEENPDLSHGVIPNTAGNIHSGPGPGRGGPVSAQIEWEKLQQEFYDRNKTKLDSRQPGPNMSSGSSVPNPACAVSLGNSVSVGHSGPLSSSTGTLNSSCPPGPLSTSCPPGPLSSSCPSGSLSSSCPPGPLSSSCPPGSLNTSCPTGPLSSSCPAGHSVPRGISAGPRLQGPPPPYHQTQRSASVPVALQSPSPVSPNNPTSNLSLPSPRASSAVNSPADPNRSFNLNRMVSTGQSPTSQESPTTSRPNPSNPGTPVSSHLSPSVTSTNTESTNSHQAPVDGMFGRTLQSMAQQKQQMGNCTATSNQTGPSSKEPNLMPVPSPQQIQYLNTFEGQELIIQKQPNTSLKDGNVSSPVLPSTVDSGFPGNNDASTSRVSDPHTPTSGDVSQRFSSGSVVSNEGCRFQIPSPHTPNTSIGEKTRLGGAVSTSGLSPQTGPAGGSGSGSGNVTGPGPLSGNGPLSSSGPMTASGPISGSGPIAGSGPLTSSGPHSGSSSGPMQGSGQGPLSGSGLLSGSVPMPGSGPMSGPGPAPGPGPSSDPLKGDIFPTPSPHMMDVHRFPGPNSSPGPKMGGNFVNVSPSAKSNPLEMGSYGCARADNLPLNPNCTSSMSGNPKVSHFDPISSLAQMSQQLTNSVASSINGQGNQGPGMMNFGSPSMHMMDMTGCHGIGDLEQAPGNMMGMQMQGPPHGYHPNSAMGASIRSLSPKLQGAFPNHMPMPRMMGRQPPGPNPYNGANVQVKPNAPNTIQYLPAKSQVGNAPGNRGPPSLDFLQRFTNPLSNLESKMPTQNLQYFPNCGPSNGPMQGPSGPMPPHLSHMEGPVVPVGPPDPGMGPMIGGPIGNGSGPMMAGGMGMPGSMMTMMRGPMRPPGMMRMPHVGFNGPNPGGSEGMFNSGSNISSPNAQMFVSGPKGSPMGMGAPDASQPLPPSMGQSNSFKNSPFVGPTTADPNYAQQYHNFQQQLYATNTRNQMGGQNMGPGPGPPHTQQTPYFNPK
ncbi:collagen alpha-2(I) chain [Agrilus planipennis]|uniref:Collagen alpha-2(I) chain n=1 Tax=Agrilus planipennis TaxID=224129 RepID=A0A1W4XAQ4_AGRPL|nr:collagen alpha-2(I) chain [Agrilus planipennis]